MIFTFLSFNKKRFFFGVIFFIFSFSAFAQCPVVVPTGADGCKLSAGSIELGASGATGFYSWYDALVGGNYLGSGAIFNTPHIASTTTYYVAAADTNYALDFDGSNDYVALGNPAQLQITGDMTIEMWLKPDNFSARRNPYAKAYGGEGTITQETNGTLNFYYGTNGGNNQLYQGFNTGTPINLSQWNHIAIVRDLVNMQLYWYINGILVNQANATYAAATAGTNPVYIGRGYVSNYDGQIEELRVWNTTRTQAQIQTNKGLCLTGAEAGLVAYYQFNDGIGSGTVTDLTANTNHGTLTNMSTATDWVVADYDYQCPTCESSRTAVIATVGGGLGVDLGNDTTFSCGSGSITLDARAGYANYLWNTGATTQTITVNTSGQFRVNVDDGAGCLDGDTINITNASGSLSALNFDGSNDHIAIGNPSQLRITGDLTLEMWLKPDNFSARRNPYAKAYGGEGTITQELNGTVNFYYGTNGGNGTPYQGFNSGTSLNLNEWNHIALVRDLTNMQLYWYINGVLTNQVVATFPSATAGGNSVYIARGYVSYYDGQIEELRVWNTIRTQTEIRNKMCSKLTGGEANLQAYYRFDDGAGTVLTDLSKNNIQGTLTNGPVWTASGASIGDSSVYLYPVNWIGQSITHSYCGGESLTVDNMSGAPAGVHIYYVNNVPTVITGVAGLGSNNRYFGVFKVNDAIATYRATYNYTGNTHAGPSSEPTIELFKRDDNADLTWVNTGATLNTGANTLRATAQGTQFILGSSGVPLPIKLISFEAVLNEGKVDLKWTTSTEINNDYFTVERSDDAKNWSELIDVNGAGNSNQTIEYFDVDYEPLMGISYYRLKQTDFNGDFTYSNIVPVKFEENKIDLGAFTVFPNPVNVGEELNVEFKDVFESELIVVLRDISGKEFFSKILLNIEGDKLIGVPINRNIPAGIYLITATSENQIYSHKLIIR